MNNIIVRVCDELESLAVKVESGFGHDALLSEINGWQCPALNRFDLANMPRKLAKNLRKANEIEIDNELLSEIDAVSINIKDLDARIVPYLYNNGFQAIPAYIATLNGIKSVLEQVYAWEILGDSKVMPASLSRKLKAIDAGLSEIIPKKEKLSSQIQLIQDATEAAETLPTDLQSLKEARSRVGSYTNDAAGLFAQIDKIFKDSELKSKGISDLNDEANKIVKQCEEAYRVTTSKGLAGAFDERAKSSATSMWVWVIGLAISLLLISCLGAERVKILADAIAEIDPKWGVIWMNLVLSILSISAPLWFAWLSTKQINQRFRLSEDYAYKAAIAKAYEGYRREAARIDEAFEARLFSTALTRLEEAPLRLVGQDSHGSPWHELFASPAFQRALDNVPELRDKFIEVAKDGISVLKKDTSKHDNSDTA